MPPNQKAKNIKVVASQVGCPLSGGGLTIDVPWLHSITGTANNNVFRYSIEADTNTSAQRTGNVSVAGFKIPVTQDAGTGVVQPPSPVISAAGIVSSASFLNGGLAPGQIVSIFGTDLGPTPLAVYEISADHVTLPTAVGATQVSFNDEFAPIIFASATQVSAIVPYSVASSTGAKVQVTYGSTPSNTVDMPVSTTAPAFFTVGNTGTGQGAFLNKDNTVNSPQNPAHPGDFVELYGTGGGLATPAYSVQTLSPSVEPLPRLTQPVTVAVGGKTLTPTYAGGTPASVPGLLQVNVQLPADVQTGGAVPITMSIGGVPSPTATIAIQ